MSVFGDSDNSRQEPEVNQQTAHEPEAPNEGQPQQQEAQDGEQQDSLILGKFKSPEELAEAYRNLEQKLGQQGQLLGILQQQLQQQAMGQPQQPQQGQERPQEVPPDKWLETFYEKGPEAVKELVDQTLTERERRQQEERLKAQQQMAQFQQKKLTEAQLLAMRHPDVPQYREQMLQIFRQYPQLALRDDGMETAYWMAKNQANRQPEQNPQKQAARMPQGSGQRMTRSQPSPDEQVGEFLFGKPAQGEGIFG